MQADLHHVHLFAANLDASIAWWRDMLDGQVAYDGDFGGARNVFMKVGKGRLHLYEQKPRGAPAGAVHHVGIQCRDLPALVARMKDKGMEFRSDIREFGNWRYIMCAAPDGVLLELFEIDTADMPEQLAAYFSGR
jgi:catechol 2,3-dioxygenase-like lactoylglutathione lyase family enzyme